MALWLETDTNANTNISSATAVGVYTATGDVFVLPQILADQVAGGGDYVYYVTLQVAGAGSHYLIGPKTTHTAAAGETALAAQGGLIFLRNGDVLTVYIDGLAGDTTTPDVTVRFAAIPLPSAAAGAAGGVPVLDANLAASANVTLWKGATVDDSVDGELPAVLSSASAQVIADALKTAPTAGDPDAGSVNKHLDDILTYAAANEPADIWSYVTRTLTQSSTSTTDSTAAGSISRRRGDSWSISLTLGAITGYTSLWFTIKAETSDADTAAIVQIKKNASGSGDGLLYVNGVAASDATKGSITISDASTGAIVIALDETITDDMTPASYNYDCQALISGSISTPDSGTFTITADVTRSVA